MRFTRLGLVLLALGATARAQIPYTGGTYSEDFDGLPSSASPATKALGPRLADGVPAVYSLTPEGLDGWSVSNYAGTGANTIFGVGPGTNNAGAVYSFGVTGQADRALGSVASGSVESQFGVTLVNHTGETIDRFTLTYTGEQWRRGSAAANVLAFSYAVGADDLNTGTYQPASWLDFVAPSTAGSNTATAGNEAAYRQSISATITGLSWAPGQTLTLRWSDVDNSGSDDGLAVDELTFSTEAGPTIVTPELVASEPADGAVGIAPESPLSLTFNTAVHVASGWFSLVGSVSGAVEATVSGGPTTYTLTPAQPFTEGESVLLTLHADGITDAASGTRQPAGDQVIAFSVATYAPIPIHEVQGAGSTSPYAGQMVTVDGVVTASFQGPGGLGGFYLQSPESGYDGTTATSEGLFVFNNTHVVSAGELVRVRGRVVEFGSGGSTQTELSNVASLTRLGTAPLPTPVEVTLPFASLTAAEAYEGMLVVLPQTLTVTDTYSLGRYGEVTLSLGRLPIPTNVAAPGVPALLQAETNLLSQIALDDGIGASFPQPTPYLADSAGTGLTRRTGSTTSGVVGILDEKFGGYIIEPTAPVSFVDAYPRSGPPAVDGRLRVVGGNVLNYFNGDGSGSGYPTSRGADSPEEFARQRAKIIAGLLAVAPDVLGLTEMENDGFGSASALADLVAGLNAAAPAGTTYAYIDSSVVDETTDVITNALIYRTETVEPVGPPAALNDAYFVGLARSPLAQTFREKLSGAVFTVSVNHFKSKGSASTGPIATDGITPNPNLDQGDGQGSSNYLRVRQAEALVSWLATDPTGSGDGDVLIIGDLNAYAKEDPIRTIETAGYLNLTEIFEGEGGYSYAFGGEFGHLDHALATGTLTEQVVGAATWHVNSDEPTILDYNLESKSEEQQALNVGTPFRYSDHDPVIVGLDLADALPPEIRAVAPSRAQLFPANHKMVAVTLAVDVVDNLDPAPATRIIAVTSNQPANGQGDGSTAIDWEITGDLTLNLRAERSAPRGDRIYTITIESVDEAGNRSTATTTVVVPHHR